MDRGANNYISLDVEISNGLSGLSIGNIIIDIIKYLAYQKLQIPYPYGRLKHIIHKRQLKELEECTSHLTLQSQKHFRIASSAVNALDTIFHNIQLQFDSPQPPREVCILLGATPVTSREVYQIVLPDFVLKTCYHGNRMNTERKQAMSVLRTIATSEILEPMLCSALPCTNMYVLLRRHSHCKMENGSAVSNDNFFTPISGYKLPRKTRLALINLRQNSSINCESCNFKIYEDLHEHLNKIDINNTSSVDKEVPKCDNLLESNETASWLLSSQLLKGFKDSYVNGQSVTDMW